MPYSIPMPEDEKERVKNLEEYNIMDTAPEMVFDEITELAAEILQCPVTTIQFLNEDRQWFKSKYGLPGYLRTKRAVLRRHAPRNAEGSLHRNILCG